jgi:hypothetical protein
VRGRNIVTRGPRRLLFYSAMPLTYWGRSSRSLRPPKPLSPRCPVVTCGMLVDDYELYFVHCQGRKILSHYAKMRFLLTFLGSACKKDILA